MDTLPLQGQVLEHVDGLDGEYDGDQFRDVGTEPDKSNVITSRVDKHPANPVDAKYRDAHRDLHKPVLDIDLPVTLVPSSTAGHYHLYIDKAMSWDTYVNLLVALGQAGILEEGYVAASMERGYTAARLPWVRKPAATDGA